MADTTTIAERFDLIAIEEYGGKVRLLTEAELLAELEIGELSVGRGLGRPEAEIRINIVSRYGDAGLRLYLKAMAER